MVKYIVLLLLTLVSNSCVIQTIKLKQLGYGIKIPVDKQFFRNKYKVSNIQNIDYNAIYMEAYYVEYGGQLFNSQDKKYSTISGFKFYENGCVNDFVIVNIDDLSDLLPLDPDETGYRGVTYFKKGKQMIAILGPVSEWQRYGIIKYEIEVKGDTLLVYNKRAHSHYIYIKQKLSEENQGFKAEW